MKLKIRREIDGWLPNMYVKLMSHKLGLKTYQPLPYLTFGSLLADRASEKRWEIIKPKLKAINPKSIIDLGCAEGYFVFMAAKETSAMVIGFDADVRRLFYATHQQLYTPQISNIGFTRAEIDVPLALKLPSVDVFFCLSLVHHMMYERGYQHTYDFMKLIKERTNMALFFEMGQSDEKTMKWANELPDMGQNPHEWIADFLYRVGFEKVELLGTSSSYNNDTNRALFYAAP